MPDKPAIPQPLANVPALVATCEALKENVEVMRGMRGSKYDVVVTWADLLRLGLVTEQDIPVDGRNRVQQLP